VKSIQALINIFFVPNHRSYIFPIYVLARMIFYRYELSNYYTSEGPAAVRLVDIESTYLRMDFTSIHI
jgi:hypothetical protein